MNRDADPLEWYYDIPIVSRVYLTGAFLTTVACTLDVISPFSVYFNLNLILYKGQVWRLVTNFLFFGHFSLDFLFHMYFLVRYCRVLEEGSFRGRTADFIYMIMFGAACMTAVAPFLSLNFLGSALTFMMVYVWGRRNRNVRMSFLGLFPFTAPYLPWVLLSFAVLLGNRATMDLIGIFVGHLYYFSQDVYPKVAELRGWRKTRLLTTPVLLHQLVGTYQAPDAPPPVVNDFPFQQQEQPQPQGQGGGGGEDARIPAANDQGGGGEGEGGAGGGGGGGGGDEPAVAAGGHLHQD